MSATPTNKPNNVTIKKREDGSLRVSISCQVGPGESPTEQSHKAECDIKNIVRRYQKAGTPLPEVHASQFTGEDLVPAPTFLEAQLVLSRGRSAFAALPAKIRDRFRNDPAQFLDFIQDPRNGEEAVKLGLATLRVEKPVDNTVPDLKAPHKKEPKAPKNNPAPKGDGGQPEGDSDQ